VLGVAWASALAVQIATPAFAGPREQAQRIYERIAGVPPSAAVLDQMAAKTAAGDLAGAAAIATDADQRLDAEFAQALDYLFRPVAQRAVRHREGKRVAAISGPENGAAEAQYVDGRDVEVEHFELAWTAQQAHRAVADP